MTEDWTGIQPVWLGLPGGTGRPVGPLRTAELHAEEVQVTSQQRPEEESVTWQE